MALKFILTAFFLFAGPIFAWAGGLKIDVGMSPAGSFQAETQKVKGYAYQTKDGIRAENVTIDMRSIKTGVGLRDKHTKERLMTDKFPTAKLVSAVGKGGKGEAVIEVKGQKKKVKGTYSVEGKTLKAQFPMQLADLGINNVRYMGLGVKNEVMVNVELPIQPEPRQPASKKK